MEAIDGLDAWGQWNAPVITGISSLSNVVTSACLQ